MPTQEQIIEVMKKWGWKIEATESTYFNDSGLGSCAKEILALFPKAGEGKEVEPFTFLHSMAEKHKVDVDKIMIGIINKRLHVWDYDEGRFQHDRFITLENIDPEGKFNF